MSQRDVEGLMDDYMERRIGRRQFMARAAGLGLSLSAAGTLLAACGSSSPTGGGSGGGATAKVGGTLRMRMLNDMSAADPAFWLTFGDELIINTINEGLVTYKPGTYERVNQLAETFEASADGLTFEFKLKEGIQFHGGYGEVTADDVKYSYERTAGIIKSKPASTQTADWDGLQEVKVTGKYTGKIIFKKFYAPLLSSTLPLSSAHVLSKKALEKLGEKHGTQPIGTGPYEFASWQQNQKVTLKRFADYGGASNDLLGGKAQWDQIDLVVIADDSAADIALETGDIDFAQIALPSISRFEANSKFSMLKGSTVDTWYLTMNVEHEKLKDARVRQAIRSAVDVPAIHEAAFEGRWDQATAMVPPSMPIGYWKDAPKRERDIEGAKALMQQAGIGKLDLQLMYSTDPGADSVAEITQQNLAEIGINVKLKKEEGASYYNVGKHLRDRELTYWWIASRPDPDWSVKHFVCENRDAWNWSYRCQPQFDTLLSQARSERDDSKRQGLYEQAQKMWEDAASEVWIAWPVNYWAHKKEIKPAVTPNGRVLPQYFKSA
jgi:peptide/nickel transport system substrate-binding protein